jgi:hypothetical protein
MDPCLRRERKIINRMLFLSLLAGALLFSGAAAQAAATITVNSGADAGGTCPGSTCTLRQAISTAASGDTINFAASLFTVTLTSAELLIDKNLTINGLAANLLTVRRSTAAGTPKFRIFEIAFGNINVTISGLTIINGNAAGGSDGGAISDQSNDGTLTVTGCTLSGNTAEGGGGGIRDDFGTVVITDSNLSGNSANNGGGIYNSNGRVSITSSTLSANSAKVDGGGIFNNTGQMNMTSSTLSTNSATGNGGGMRNHNSDFKITSSTLSGNSAANGGGIINDDGGTMSVTNSTLSANSASSLVGGIDTSQGDDMIVSNTIIAKNTDTGGDPDFNGTLESQGYNLVGNDSGTTITPTTGDQIGTAASPIDPLLGPLQNNGGPTQTQALLPGSPAIDKGSAATDPITGNPITADQRGLTRPVDDSAISNATGGKGSDIGAFEAQPPGSLLNISTRMRVLTGEHVLIAGFIITGSDPKEVLVRGLGPSVGVSGSLADPTLELHDASSTLATDDNWQDKQRAEIEATTIPPPNPLESAILQTLPANKASYTAILRGKADATGIGLVEVYDLAQDANSKLANISTRGFVDTGDNVMIGGFIIGPVQAGGVKVIVRAIGPSLKAAGVTGVLADPTLELHDSNGGVLASNNNWRTDQEAEIEATTIPPSNDLESAIVRTLVPGNYTAIVRGVKNTTGVALVEVYALN